MIDYQKEKINRLLEIRRSLNIKQSEMAEKIGMKQPNLSAIENGRSGKDVLENLGYILQDKLGISKLWFDTGNGEMIINNKKSDEDHNLIPVISGAYGAKPNKPNRSYMNEIKKLINEGRDEPIEMTSIYNVHFTEGKISTYDTNNIPDLLSFNGAFRGCHIVIRHTDASMHDTFPLESFIGLKKIEKDSFTKRIVPGKCYVVVLKDYIIERFLYPMPDVGFILRSSNPDKGPEFTIEFDEIVELYLITGWIDAPKLKPI